MSSDPQHCSLSNVLQYSMSYVIDRVQVCSIVVFVIMQSCCILHTYAVPLYVHMYIKIVLLATSKPKRSLNKMYVYNKLVYNTVSSLLLV